MGRDEPVITKTIDEAYFLLRTGMWGEEEFKAYVDEYRSQGYRGGYDDGYDYGRDSVNNDIEFERGYDKGYKDGEKDGWQEGYDEGYNEASKGEDYRR